MQSVRDNYMKPVFENDTLLGILQMEVFFFPLTKVYCLLLSSNCQSWQDSITKPVLWYQYLLKWYRVCSETWLYNNHLKGLIALGKCYLYTFVHIVTFSPSWKHSFFLNFSVLYDLWHICAKWLVYYFLYQVDFTAPMKFTRGTCPPAPP